MDIDPQQTEQSLRFVVAPSPTPALAAYSNLLPPPASQQRDVEVCPEGLVLAQEVSRRVVGGGGAALIADYGEEEVAKHTLRVS